MNYLTVADRFRRNVAQEMARVPHSTPEPEKNSRGAGVPQTGTDNARYIFEALRHQVRRSVIEVRTNPDVVDTGHLTDVIDMIDHARNVAARGSVGFDPIGDPLLHVVVRG